MSDVGRLKRPGESLFPTIRKSPDPLQPAMGEIEFSQEIHDFDTHHLTSISESEKVEQNVISEENKKKQFRYQQRKQAKKEESPKVKSDEDNLVDLSA